MAEGDEELAREAYAAFNRGDLPGALRRLDPEIEWHMSSRFARGARVYRGHDGVRAIFANFAETFDDFRTEPLEVIDTGERLVVPVRMTGRQRGDGGPVEIELVQVWTTRRQLAVRLDVFLSMDDAMSFVSGGGEPPLAEA